ncbi:MAG: hypothetical protein AAGF83_08340 [Cyanobacteria bacterium P01_G01_bin.67]
MVLNQLKQIRDELKSSAKSYDTAFKNTALIAASELSKKQTLLEQTPIVDSKQQTKLNSNLIFDKEYFIANYGSLKNAKVAYQKLYGKQKFGRSWSEFIAIAQKLALASSKSKTLTLEERITKIENFLVSLGYQI